MANSDQVSELYFGHVMDERMQLACRKRVHWLCGQADGKKVLDVGCSQGITSILLGREGFTVNGIDVEQPAIDHAAQLLCQESSDVQARVSFAQGDAANMPFDTGAFDSALLGEVIEHVVHPDKILKEVSRAVKKGGRIAITTPLGLHIFHDHKAAFYLTDFLDLVEKVFTVEAVRLVDKTILCSARNEPSKRPFHLRSNAFRSLVRSSEEEWLAFEERVHLQSDTWKERNTKLTEAHELVRTAYQESLEDKSRLMQKLHDRIDALNAQLISERDRAASAIGELKNNGTQIAHLTEQLTKAQDSLLSERERSTALIGDLRTQTQAAKHVQELRLEMKAALDREQERSREAVGRALQLEAEAAQHVQELRLEMKAALDTEQERSREAVGRALQLEAERDGLAERVRQDSQRAVEATRAASDAEQRCSELARKLAAAERDIERTTTQTSNLQREVHTKESEVGRETQARVLAEARCRDVRDSYTYRLGDTIAKGLARPSVKTILLPWHVVKLLIEGFRLSLSRRAGGRAPKHSPGTVPNPAPQTSKGQPTTEPAARLTPSPTPPADVAPISLAPKIHIDPASTKPPLACILDEFTTPCFQPECQMITFRPDNWRETLELYPPKAVFVESAWRGNDGSWQYRVAKYQKNMGDELLDILNWAREQGIPSAFWNKEDPVHFDRFIDNASQFSHIFTTDADCVPRYTERAGHAQVFPLPFAAQPSMHNPILESRRNDKVCFAGTYYSDRHDQRRQDMDLILRPALEFDLDIYDRRHGLTGPQGALFRFPDAYQPAIRGRLEYDEMVRAYKQYRVFLNVNSVKASPTMFSRRVFELLACGTPVISTHSKGIVELLGEDIVFLTESEADTRKHLEKLLNDRDAWRRASIRGIRKVLTDHTYHNRMQYVLERLEIRQPRIGLPSFAVAAMVRTPDQVQRLAEMVQHQSVLPSDVLLLIDGKFSEQAIRPLRDTRVRTVTIFTDRADPFRNCLEATQADYVAIMDPRDYYAPNYLQDYAVAAGYADAPVLGKHTYFAAQSDQGAPEELCPGYEFRYVGSVPCATAAFSRTGARPVQLERGLTTRVLRSNGEKILSLDCMNYLQFPDAEPGHAPPPIPERARQRVEV